MHETLLQIILNNLASLLPFAIVRSYQRGVRWTMGRNPRELLPGVRLKVWLLHQVEILDCADEVINLPVQSIITKDEKLVCFSVNIGFRIVNIVDHFCNVQDFAESTAGLATTHLAKRVRAKTLSELTADLSDLETSLRGTLTTQMKRWGTEVFAVGFTNFAEVPRQMRIFLDTLPRL